MRKFANWFTAERRQAIQLFAGSLAPLLILFGFGTEGQWDQYIIIVGLLLQFVSSLLSLVNLRHGDWSGVWTIVRGAIYTLGMGAAPALAALGFWDDNTSSVFLLGMSLTLGALSNLVSILTSSRQSLDQANKTIRVLENETRRAYQVRTENRG